MAQPILKRRLNPLLLISTVAALSLLAGVAVISQDRIAAAQQNVSETTQQLQDAQDRVQELSLQSENKTRRMNALESNLTSTYSELQTLQEELENKTQRIQSLQNQLEEQQENQEQSNTIQNMNESLGIVCALYSGDSNTAEENCNEWNHEVGTASES
jgi:septal ring factor EnvC (AmiA/AmiB activator)